MDNTEEIQGLQFSFYLCECPASGNGTGILNLWHNSPVTISIRTSNNTNAKTRLMQPLYPFIIWKETIWKYSIQSLITTYSVLLSLFMSDNGRCDIPYAALLCFQICVERYSPKWPEHVKISTLYWCPPPGLSAALLANTFWTLQDQRTRKKIITLYRCTGRRFRVATLHNDSYCDNLKRGPLEIQHPKFENRRLGFTESVHER